jgi:putative PIG3 family NAD(P)H quinone oxidoreductase
MHAISVTDGTLRWADQPPPVPGAGQVRIRVVAAGVNRADLVQRAGRYPPPPGASPILGLEVAGVVDRAVDGGRFSVGDEVCALLTGGGYATHVVVEEDLCLPVPEGLDLVQAAALVEVWATAWRNLVELGRLTAGERVLIHAGASGVGTAAIQLCQLLGARAFVTAGSQDKLDRCVALGAEGGANRHDGPWVEAVRAWAGGVDVILDPVGAGYLEQAQQVLDSDGRWVLIGLMGGRSAQIDLGRLLMKRQQLLGSTLRALPVARKAPVLRALETTVWPALSSGRVRPIVHATVPMLEAERAHALVASNETVGKVVLTAP